MGHQVIDENADIGPRPVEHDRRRASRQPRRIEPGEQALSRRLLIAGGAVDLASQEEPGNRAGLERVLQGARIDEIILDGVTGTQHSRSFQSRNGLEQAALHILRQGGRDPVRIDRVVVEPLGLEKDLVAVAVAEPADLVFDRWAIARATALDLPRKHRRAVKIGANQVMSRRGRARDAAAYLRILDLAGQSRERLRRRVARLHLQRRPVDGPTVEPGRRPGLEPTERKAVPLQCRRQAQRGSLAHAAGRNLGFPDMNQAAQKRPGRHDDRSGRESTSIGQQHRRYAALADLHVEHVAGDDLKIGPCLEQFLHGVPIELAIRLGTGATDRRPLAAIEHPELDAAAIGRERHDAVESVDLANQMALAQPADRRVARHDPDEVRLVRDQSRARAVTRRSRGGLGAGMAATDDDDIVGLRETRHRVSLAKPGRAVNHRMRDAPQGLLLADAESGKERVQHVLDADPPDQPLERHHREADVLGQ